MNVQVVEGTLPEEKQTKLAELVHACCTACMYMQAGCLEFDFASIFQQPFAAGGCLDGGVNSLAATARLSGHCDLSFWSPSTPRIDTLLHVSHDTCTTTGRAAHQPLLCMPGAVSAPQAQAPGSRALGNVAGQPNRQQQLAKLLSDVVGR